MIQHDPQTVGDWDGSTEVLLPTIFDASELRSDFNGKVMRGEPAVMATDGGHWGQHPIASPSF